MSLFKSILNKIKFVPHFIYLVILLMSFGDVKTIYQEDVL